MRQSPNEAVFETEALNLPRMRQERLQKLQGVMAQQDVDALVLLGSSNVQYATGAVLMTADAARMQYLPALAIVQPDRPAPLLFTPYAEGAPPELPAEQVRPPIYPDSEEGTRALARALREALGERAAARIAFDSYTPAMFTRLPELLPNATLIDASTVLGAAKIIKTADEIECIRRAQRLNELAMYDVQAALRPGIRQTELSGIFLRRIFELGASANIVDPIWQVIPSRLAEGPFTVHGDLAFPLCTTDQILREGDVLMVDSGISYHGYASDFGRTWIVSRDPRPSERQRDLFKQWQEVVERVLAALRPGITAYDLCQAALAGRTPKAWLKHFYLAHGIGTDSAEMPLIGTDLGEEFDKTLVLGPGMILVLEPVTWEEGYGGYRSEEVVVITETGYRLLSDYPYAPYA